MITNHPINTFVNEHGKLCDEYGVIDARNDSLEKIYSTLKENTLKWKSDAVKNFNDIKEEFLPNKKLKN